MKLIKVEDGIAIEVINDEDFILIDSTTNMYMLDSIRYVLTPENDLYEVEDDEPTDMESASEEA